MSNIRKIAAGVLTVMVLAFTVMAVGAIWDWWEVEDVFNKSLKTLLVIFISSAILLFIFAVIYKAEEGQKPKPPVT
ncbi:MAG: hypothetical protein IT233_11915 [Bacteroidia bacterium]|nr:hypothetical protein [Bacteroidia bacterium]